MPFVLCDLDHQKDFYPFTLNKAIAALEVGTSTIQAWWQFLLKEEVFIHTADYLQKLYKLPPSDPCIFIDARVVPDSETISLLKNLSAGERLYDEEGTIAVNGASFHEWKKEVFAEPQIRLTTSRDLIEKNAAVIQMQTEVLASEKETESVAATAMVTGPRNQIFVELDVVMEHVFINTTAGPVYIAEGAKIMEGAMLRGPLFVGPLAVIKMGAKVYGGTSIMRGAVAGGEIKNSILMQFCNKAHDGYLGDSVIGQWCNIGAGTSNSNIKNTASESAFLFNKSKQLKAGVLMGDFCRTAINTRINTGSVFGVCCNIVGEKWPPAHLPPFSWFQNEAVPYRIEKSLAHINNWMKLKDHALSAAEQSVLQYIFERLTNV